MKRWLWVAAVVSTYACHGGETEPQQAPSASSSSSAAAELDPVDAYCGAIESEWRSVDSQCTSEQRAMPEHAQARAAVTAAVAKCRALLAASHAAGRIAFEPKVIVNHDYTCSAAVKYEWAVLAPLTRLQSNCSRTRLAGLVSERSPCSYSFECRSHVCNAGSCSKPLAEGESCASVEPTVLDRATPCAEGLYCDQVPAAPLIAGYPPPSGKSARADFPIRPGRVVVEPVREGSGPTRDISKWAAEIRPYLVRCFEAALARDAKTRGALTLDVPLEGSPAVVVSEVPDLLRDCAAEIVHWRSPDPAARIRIQFHAAPSAKAVVSRVRSGKCLREGIVDSPCESHSDCYQGLECNDWKCSMEDGPQDCANDSDCFMTQRCVRAQCIPRGGDGHVCAASVDCGLGVCVAGSCRAMCASKSGPRFDPD